MSKTEWIQTFQVEFGGTERQARGLFEKLDKDGSGDIDLTEVSQLFKDMDTDGMTQIHMLMGYINIHHTKDLTKEVEHTDQVIYFLYPWLHLSWIIRFTNM